MHIYNWKRDLPDLRDFKYALHMLKVSQTPVALPTKVDLRPFCSPIENQDQLGSCTSFALAGAMEFLEEQSLSSNITSSEILIPKLYTPFSHLFIYYNERVIEGTIKEDGGGMLRDGIKTLASLGDCSELIWAYDESKIYDKPSEAAYQEAISHKISYYLKLESSMDMRNCLGEGFPFVFGATLYNSFEEDVVAKTGIVSMPSIEESVIGGHALLCVGMDIEKQYYIVRNSWSNSWGDKGYCYFPIQYLENQDLCTDMWTIRK